MLCNKTVAVDHSGISQVNQHAGSSNQRLVFLQTNQSLRRLETTLNFAVNHCKQDIWKQNAFGHSKLPNKTGVFDLVTISTHFSIMFLCEVSEKFSVGHTKMSDIVQHGLSEVLLNELVDDNIKASAGTVIYIINATF